MDTVKFPALFTKAFQLSVQTAPKVLSQYVHHYFVSSETISSVYDNTFSQERFVTHNECQTLSKSSGWLVNFTFHNMITKVNKELASTLSLFIKQSKVSYMVSYIRKLYGTSVKYQKRSRILPGYMKCCTSWFL